MGRADFPNSALKQKALWWTNPVNDVFGERSYDPAVEIKCRWQNRSENFMDAQGNEKVSRAVVYVDREVNLGDYLERATTSDLTSGEEEPYDRANALEIKGLGESSSVDAERFVRKVWL